MAGQQSSAQIRGSCKLDENFLLKIDRLSQDDNKLTLDTTSHDELRRKAFGCSVICFVIGLALLFSVCSHALRKDNLYLGKLTRKPAEVEMRPKPSSCVMFANWTRTKHRDSGQEDSLHISSTSIELPLSSDTLYLLSRGLLAKGSVRITATAPADSDRMIVDIAMSYKYDDEFENTAVCLVRPGGQYGVGVYTPEHLDGGRRYWTNFDIEVRLPPSSAGIPTLVKDLRTDMIKFALEVGDLEGEVFFDSVELVTVDAPITALSLVARRLILTTRHDQIRGSFTISGQLVMLSAFAFTEAGVKLLNGADGNPTVLSTQTSNGLMNLTTTLVSTSLDGTEGDFMIDAHTTNAPLLVKIFEAPVDHVLNLTTSTLHGPAWVFLPPTWEGTFCLSSSGGPAPQVDAMVTAIDPAGLGRERVVVTANTDQGVINGYAEWVPGQERRGSKAQIVSSSLLWIRV